MRTTIQYQVIPEIDFGSLTDECSLGSIKVDKAFWKEYCDKRYELDVMQGELYSKIPYHKRSYNSKLIKHFKTFKELRDKAIITAQECIIFMKCKDVKDKYYYMAKGQLDFIKTFFNIRNKDLQEE